MLGPLGLFAASLGPAVTPIQDVIVVAATGALMVSRRMGPRQSFVLGALFGMAFLAAMAFVGEPVHNHWPFPN